jgi:hypothetical protein
VDQCDGNGQCVLLSDTNDTCADPTDCDGGETCNPETGDCEPNADPAASTPCTDTDGNDCTEAACDGMGFCNQEHILPDGKPCADTDGNQCTEARCDGFGTCDQDICAPDGKPACEIRLGDFIWDDFDGDGEQDGGEPGLSGVDLNLLDCSANSILASQATGVAGDYEFTLTAVDMDCEPISLDLLVEVDDSNFDTGLSGFTASPRDNAADAVDSDCAQMSPFQTDCTTYPAGTDDDTVDCGFSNRIDVAVDIKPGSCPNSYNRDNRGVLPVSLVGTGSFDVSQVDLTTLKLCLPGENPLDPMAACATPHEGPPGPHTVLEDAAAPFGGEPCDCHELEGDGILDVMMKFKTQQLVPALSLDDFAAGEVVPLELHGNLLPAFGAQPFAGQDCVRFVPSGSPPNMLKVKSPRESWIDIAPLDDQLDAGGFGAEFERTYPTDTDAVLTAAPEYRGRAFLGWRGDDGRLIPSETVMFRVNGHVQTLEAVYDGLSRRCGLGYELGLLVVPLAWLLGRQRRKRA